MCLSTSSSHILMLYTDLAIERMIRNGTLSKREVLAVEISMSHQQLKDRFAARTDFDWMTFESIRDYMREHDPDAFEYLNNKVMGQ